MHNDIQRFKPLYQKYKSIKITFIKKSTRITLIDIINLSTMVLIWGGNSEHVAQTGRKIGLFGEKKSEFDCSRSNQVLYTNKITDIPPYVRTFFSVYIYYKYHGRIQFTSVFMYNNNYNVISTPIWWDKIQYKWKT